MIKSNKAGILVTLALLCAGCSTGSMMESKKIDYRSAGKLPPLEIPPDLTQPRRDDRFSIPEVKGATSYSAYAVERGTQPKAGASDLLPALDKVRIDRSGSQRWLVVPGTPESLWNSVKDFWQEIGFIIKIEIPEAGIMETDWAENRAKIPQDAIRTFLGKFMDSLFSSGERDKFRTRLERGVQPGTTEIYVSNRGVQEVYTNSNRDQTVWKPKPADPELEAEMLSRMLVRFGLPEERARAMVAESPKDARAHILDAPGGAGALDVAEPFDRAWRRVGLALDRVGFTVEDRDRSRGLYFVRYVDPDIDQRQAEKGFFSRLFSKTDEKTAEQYRVAVKDEKSRSKVEVQSKDGAADGSPAARKILELLLDQLK
jgi:outer membrane protein assembly factor BamC